ncbi:MAG: NmrA family NAD(P)-binding protein [Rhizobiaceae bacterium]|nr:NmrA family NAD(P)-binding protein [Rhizobiaceae bacterium]
MKTIAILGARGRLGRTVGKAFLEAGYSVRAVTRDGKLPSELNSAQAIAADALDQAALVRATQGMDVIFNGLNPLYTDWVEMCMPMARNVMAACKASGALHLFPGNVYNFDSPLPAELREDLPFNPTSRKGRIRVDMEQLFESASRERGVRTAILRAGDFFGGTGKGSWFDLVMTKKLGKGVYTTAGPTNIVHEWAYLPDLARAFVALVENVGKLGRFEVFHFAGHAVTEMQMKAAAEKALGKQLRMGTLPWWTVRVAGMVNAMMWEIAEMSYLRLQPHRLVSDRLEAIIGAVPYTPLSDAVADALTDLGFEPAARRNAA